MSWSSGLAIDFEVPPMCKTQSPKGDYKTMLTIKKNESVSKEVCQVM